MFDPTSRYAQLKVKTFTTADAAVNANPGGQTAAIRYVERRFLPPADAGTPLIEHLVTQGDRLDNVTARYLGDPTQFWRVADANDALHPEEFTEEPGQRIVISLPQ